MMSPGWLKRQFDSFPDWIIALPICRSVPRSLRMSQVAPRATVYDVCIIGSGAGGGTAAKVLTEGGLSVVMLEAGPVLNPEQDFEEHVWPYELPHRGADIGGRARHELNTEFMAPNGFWEISGEPYTTAPGSSFRWFRSRIEGGRTNHWGRIASALRSRRLPGALHRRHGRRLAHHLRRTRPLLRQG